MTEMACMNAHDFGINVPEHRHRRKFPALGLTSKLDEYAGEQ